MDEGIRMVSVIFKKLKKRLIKPFSVFDKFDSRSQYTYIHVVIKILASVEA